MVVCSRLLCFVLCSVPFSGWLSVFLCICIDWVRRDVAGARVVWGSRVSELSTDSCGCVLVCFFVSWGVREDAFPSIL